LAWPKINARGHCRHDAGIGPGPAALPRSGDGDPVDQPAPITYCLLFIA
jgi:hypothetical protein